MNNTITTLIIALTTVGAVIFLGNGYLTLSKEKANNDAIQGCMQISTYTTHQPDKGVTITEPVPGAYNKCLELKGISAK